MEINQQLEQPEEKHTKESALFFMNNESEKNKLTAFLRYYRDEEISGSRPHSLCDS